MAGFTKEQIKWLSIYQHWKEARALLESTEERRYDLEEQQVIDCLQRRGISQEQADIYLKAQNEEKGR
jgi:hypothetical protein